MLKFQNLAVCAHVAWKVPPRRTQPKELSADEVCNVLALTAPKDARDLAKSKGELFDTKVSNSRGWQGKDVLKKWHKCMHSLLKLNPSGVFSQTTMASGIALFSENVLDGIITGASKDCI